METLRNLMVIEKQSKATHEVSMEQQDDLNDEEPKPPAHPVSQIDR